MTGIVGISKEEKEKEYEGWGEPTRVQGMYKFKELSQQNTGEKIIKRERKKKKQRKNETGGQGKQKDKQGEWKKKSETMGSLSEKQKNQKVRTERRGLSNSQGGTHRFKQRDK